MKKSFLLLSSTVLLMSNLFGTVYSDGTNPEDWKYYTSSKGEISTENGAISLKGNGTKSGVYLQLSPITKDASTIKWRMKFKNYFKLYVQVATNKGIRYLTYYPLNNFSKKSGRFLQIGLGKSARNDKWQTFTRDVNRDLETLERGLKLREIKAFFLRGTGLIDDVEVNKDDNTNPPDSNFDFKKFDELLKAEDDGEWGVLSKTTIFETGNPRIKGRFINYFMDNPPYRAIYTLSRDNTHLVTIDPNDPNSYYGYGTVKVSKDNKKLIIDDGWQNYKYVYRELDITNLPNVSEISNSKKSKLFDIVGRIASNKKKDKNYVNIYKVTDNGSLRDDIVGITETVYNPASSTEITFYMMNKSEDKAEKILQTKMRGYWKEIATVYKAGNHSFLNIGTSQQKNINYVFTNCLQEVKEGCAELVD